jgi:hypothetical protein
MMLFRWSMVVSEAWVISWAPLNPSLPGVLWLLKPATMVTNPDIYLNDKFLCRAISGLILIVVSFCRLRIRGSGRRQK